jgi:hypothetical protein
VGSREGEEGGKGEEQHGGLSRIAIALIGMGPFACFCCFVTTARLGRLLRDSVMTLEFSGPGGLGVEIEEKRLNIKEADCREGTPELFGGRPAGFHPAFWFPLGALPHYTWQAVVNRKLINSFTELYAASI